MSQSYQMVMPTPADVAARVAATGGDYINAQRDLQFQAVMAAIETIQDIDDVKKFLRDVMPKVEIGS